MCQRQPHAFSNHLYPEAWLSCDVMPGLQDAPWTLVVPFLTSVWNDTTSYPCPTSDIVPDQPGVCDFTMNGWQTIMGDPTVELGFNNSQVGRGRAQAGLRALWGFVPVQCVSLKADDRTCNVCVVQLLQ